MKTMLSLALLVMAIFIGLAITNPSRDDFYAWIEQTHQTDEQTHIVDKLFIKGAELQANFNVTFDDKVVLTLASTEIYGEKMRFLGIIGNWYVLEEKQQQQ